MRKEVGFADSNLSIHDTLRTFNNDIESRASQKSKRFYNWIIGTLTLYMIIKFLHEIWLNIYLIGINFSHL